MATPIDRGEVLYQLERLALEAQLMDECEEETIRRCIKAIEQMVPTLTPPNEWVSVEERLPDKPGHYLVCTSVNYWHGGCMDKNVVSSNKGTTDGYVGTTLSVLDCFYDMTGDWNRVCNKHVTHWMSLPEPPNRRPPEGET